MKKIILNNKTEKNHFRQHIPGCVSGVEPKEFYFETTEELINNKLIQGLIGKDFSHFALNDDALLMIINKGLKWFVLGYIKNPKAVNLPKWEKITYSHN